VNSVDFNSRLLFLSAMKRNRIRGARTKHRVYVEYMIRSGDNYSRV